LLLLYVKMIRQLGAVAHRSKSLSKLDCLDSLLSNGHRCFAIRLFIQARFLYSLTAKRKAILNLGYRSTPKNGQIKRFVVNESEKNSILFLALRKMSNLYRDYKISLPKRDDFD
jgi:hypothetical protein